MATPLPRSAPAAQLVRRHARPLDDPRVLDALLDRLGRARFALLGEASHGTHDFYALRADLTRRLITDHGCQAVVIEGDWPDAWRVNRWVRGDGDAGGSADDALAGFERFPTWMWRNTVMRDFIEWLREYNRVRPPWQRVGVYGMDLYSLFASIRAVLGYLEQVDPEAARQARSRYACFDHFQQNLQAYGYMAGSGASNCEDHVVAQLQDLLRSQPPPMADGDPDALFHAQQNARLVKNAEQYYRSMFKGRASSWNLRDLHMADTVQALCEHLATRSGTPARMAVWAHNSHLGDASATAMGDEGEWNVGELMRQRFPGEVALLGFTTYSGTVRAATAWDEPGEVVAVRPGLPGSWEALFHEAGPSSRFLLMPQEDAELATALSEPLLERAIGVIYAPQTERQSHYFEARLARQFDAVIHLDETRAIEPLPHVPQPEPTPEAPQTYPDGT